MSRARVSVSQVKELIATAIEDSVILANMVDTANVIVDTHLLDAGLSDALLAKIELYLSAHFVAITEEKGALKSEKLGDSTDTWDTSYVDAGFNTTRFGQTALTLDSSGKLANASTSNLKAEFRIV